MKKRNYYVQGNEVMGPEDRPWIMKGVSRPGFEYASIDPSLFSSLPEQEILDMISWGFNTLRLPLRDRFWLDDYPQYRQRIHLYIETAISHHMAVILDLHTQRDHALSSEDAMILRPDGLAFWLDVCSVYGTNDDVFFELFNEPYVSDPRVWWEGDETYHGYGEILHHLRSSGSPCAHTTIILGGMDYGYQWSFLSQEENVMNDMLSLGNVLVSTHPYAYRGGPNETCVGCTRQIPISVLYPTGGASSSFTGNCTFGYTLPQIQKDGYESGWDASFGFLQSRFPVVATEFGLDHLETSLQGGWYMNAILSYFESRHMGFVAWAWVRDRLDYPSLLSPEDTPTGRASSPNPGPSCGVMENHFYQGPGVSIYHHLRGDEPVPPHFLLRKGTMTMTLHRPPPPPLVVEKTTSSSGWWILVLFLPVFVWCWWSCRLERTRIPRRRGGGRSRQTRRGGSCFF